MYVVNRVHKTYINILEVSNPNNLYEIHPTGCGGKLYLLSIEDRIEEAAVSCLSLCILINPLLTFYLC